jgi:hypothetical protein
MIKKIIPYLFIIFIWLIFSKPFFIENKIPFPADYQANHFSLWSSYKENWGPVRNPSQPDVISQLMPWKSYTIESIKKGNIPFWNLYSFSGTPHLANYQSSSFSISNLFYFIFDFNTAWGLAVLIQPLLAGIFTYLFARSIKRSELASLFPAISFMFCSFITTWMSYTTLSLAISFLPLALFAIEKFFDTNKHRFLMILAISIPLSFFSGHFQTSLYFLLFIILYTLFKYADTKDKIKTFHTFLYSTLGIFLSLPQILPSIELYQNSTRSNIFQKIEAVPIRYLPTIISPDFFGNPVTRNVSLGNYAEWGSFFGAIPFFLSIYSLFKRNVYIIFFLSTGSLALLFSLDTSVLDLLINARIPVISTSSASRILVLFSFSFSMLAAFGVDNLINDLKNKTALPIIKWIAICFLLLLTLWILIIGRFMGSIDYFVTAKGLIISTSLFLTILLAVLSGLLIKRLIITLFIILLIFTSFEMIRFSTKWQSFSDKKNIFKDTKIISELKKLDKTYRIYGAFGAEGAVYYALPSAEGYDPLYINRYGEFIGSLENGDIKSSPSKGLTLPTNANFFPNIIDFIGIKYVLLKESDRGKEWAFPFNKFPNKFNLIYQDNEFSIYENKDVFPKALLVGDYIIEANDQKIIDRVLNKNYDLRNSVVLEKNPEIRKTNNLVGETRIISYSANNIKLETDSNSDSILVLNDNYYPGWKARINGEEKEIIRANYSFRALSLPSGNNKVEFYYDSQAFKWGIYFAAISIVIIFIFSLNKWYNIGIWKAKSKTVTSVTKSFVKTVNGRQAKKKLKK